MCSKPDPSRLSGLSRRWADLLQAKSHLTPFHALSILSSEPRQSSTMYANLVITGKPKKAPQRALSGTGGSR